MSKSKSILVFGLENKDLSFQLIYFNYQLRKVYWVHEFLEDEKTALFGTV